MPRNDNDRGLQRPTLPQVAEWVNQKATPGRFDWIPVFKGPYKSSLDLVIDSSTPTAVTGLEAAARFNARMKVVLDLFVTCAVTTAPISGLSVLPTVTPTPISSDINTAYLMTGDPGIWVIQSRSVFEVPANVEYTFGAEAWLDSVAAGEVTLPGELVYFTLTGIYSPSF